jgi:long-chain acyl-CoA synthetase
VISEDQEQVDKVLEVQEDLPSLDQMIYLDPQGMRKYDHSKLHELKKVKENGSVASGAERQELEARIERLDFQSVCVMLYTSGTTGKPKGVVLSNRNIIVSSLNGCKFDSIGKDDEMVSYLPIAWVGDFIFTFGQSVVSGVRVNCPESPETVLSDLREIGPSYYFAPPRIFESMLTSVMLRIEDTSAIKKWLYHYFMAHASKVGPSILDKKICWAVGSVKIQSRRVCDLWSDKKHSWT